MRSLESLKKSSKKALVIVAHPDDESLFMGGTIAQFKRWHWRILCVTDCDWRYNRRRRQELLKACRIYKRNGSDVKPFMLGAARQKSQFSKTKIAQKLRNFIVESGPFDLIFTHNKIGDYEHRTHKLIHSIVKESKLSNVYNFSLTPSKSAQAVRLSPASYRAKRRALSIYMNGSQKTNLTRLKKVVSYALNTKIERFIKVN